MAKKDDNRHENSGRKDHQKMKPFLIYEYLMRESDEEHYVTTDDIKEYLDYNFGISAERRSIYRDIQEINKALLAIDEDITIEKADELIDKNENNKIIHHHKRKGFYVTQRKYNEEDIRLLAECVHAAKFVDEERADLLIDDVILKLVSVHQAENMSRKAIVKDRVKTTNTEVYYTVTKINQAIGNSGSTKKIKFRYLKYTIQDIRNQVERRGGAEYIVTPYSLVIDNGNYYLLAYEEKSQDIRTYRVDRMKSVKILNEVGFVDEKIKDLNIEQYTQGHFGMFSGNRERVNLLCKNKMLDTMIDRFGIDNVLYTPSSKSGYFNVRVPVYISHQFFGWLAGLGTQVKIIEPISVKEQYEDYLKELYEWNKGSSKR